MNKKIVRYPTEPELILPAPAMPGGLPLTALLINAALAVEFSMLSLMCFAISIHAVGNGPVLPSDIMSLIEISITAAMGLVFGAMATGNAWVVLLLLYCERTTFTPSEIQTDPRARP